VLIPVLPLHGPRRIGRMSGDGFLSGNVLDTIHAEAQAVWDARRLIGWARAEGAPLVGVHGLSLGGYTTALLASLQEGLSCVIAGIPVADLARTFWRHGPRFSSTISTPSACSGPGSKRPCV
jgi:dienelactone hydrolase